MAWLTLRQIEATKLHDAIAELDAGSHRAIAVVGGAFVEEHLTLLLRSRLESEPVGSDKDMANEMFRPGGPLGDFGNKIALGYLIGLYGKGAWKELDTIRYIRNAFAHNVDTNSFGIQRIKARCANLTLWEIIKIKMRPDDNKGFSIILATELSTAEQELLLIDFVTDDEKLPTLPHERFIAACRFFIAAFSILMQTEYQRPTVLL